MGVVAAESTPAGLIRGDQLRDMRATLRLVLPGKPGGVMWTR